MIENPAIELLTAKATTGAGPNVPLSSPNQYPYRDLHVELAGTGAVTATVTLERSLNNGRNWRTHAGTTITLSGTGNDGYYGTIISNGAALFRLNVTAISGTGANVSAWIA